MAFVVMRLPTHSLSMDPRTLFFVASISSRTESGLWGYFFSSSRRATRSTISSHSDSVAGCPQPNAVRAQAAAAAIEARYSDEDLERLIRAQGIDVLLHQPFTPAADGGQA